MPACVVKRFCTISANPPIASRAPMMARIMRQEGATGKAASARRDGTRMRRAAQVARFGSLMAVVLGSIVLVACGGASSTPDDAPASGEAAEPLVLPASALPRMTSEMTAVDADRLVNEVAHPDELRALLDRSGFASAAQRSFGEGEGAFSRVLARGLAFETEAGAAAFVSWFEANAPEEIVTAERIAPKGLPEGVVVFRHRPDGCCHNDVPVYLAAWQRGSAVLSLHVGGRRANTRAFAELISSYDRAV